MGHLDGRADPHPIIPHPPSLIDGGIDGGGVRWGDRVGGGSTRDGGQGGGIRDGSGMGTMAGNWMGSMGTKAEVAGVRRGGRKPEVL